jgi:hypothetical protein
MRHDLREDQVEYLRKFADGEPHQIEDRTRAPAANLIRREFLAYAARPSMYRLTAKGLEAVRASPLSRIVAEAIVEQGSAERDLLEKVVADYERRRRNPWGRFLLWLLRHTT